MDGTLRQLLQELFNATRELAEARRRIAELEAKVAEHQPAKDGMAGAPGPA